jgi:creatinine amidohydrolase
MDYSIFKNTMVDMTYPQIEEAIAKKACVLLPVSVVEEHGPHLCLGTDIYLTQTVSEKIQKRLQSENCEVLIAPPFYWGINSITNGFPGSFAISPETMSIMLLEIIGNFIKWGFDKIFLLNFHGDFVHIKTIIEIVKKANNENIKVYFINSKSVFSQLGYERNDECLVKVELEQGEISMEEQYLDIHAGAFETSWMLHSYEKLVNIEIAEKLIPTNLNYKELKNWAQGGDVAKKITPMGYFGNPANIDVEIMNKIEMILIDKYSNAILKIL